MYSFSFAPSLRRSFVHFVPSFFRRFVASPLRCFVASLLRSFVFSLFRSFFPFFLCSFVPSVLRSFAHSFALSLLRPSALAPFRSFAHSVIRAFAHSIRSICHAFVPAFASVVPLSASLPTPHHCTPPRPPRPAPPLAPWRRCESINQQLTVIFSFIASRILLMALAAFLPCAACSGTATSTRRTTRRS